MVFFGVLSVGPRGSAEEGGTNGVFGGIFA
jgi:hypothetical protein